MTDEKRQTYPFAVQYWMCDIPVMQQSVLLSAIRGPDGFRKHHPVKALLRWYRRCVLISAFDGAPLWTPCEPGGGSFTGPSLTPYGRQEPGEPILWTVPGSGYADADIMGAMRPAVDAFVHARDEMGLHYFAHAMHAFEVLGYKHPVPATRAFWRGVYERMVNALHLVPEPEEEMDRRLGDAESEWALKADEAGSCSE